MPCRRRRSYSFLVFASQGHAKATPTDFKMLNIVGWVHDYLNARIFFVPPRTSIYGMWFSSQVSICHSDILQKIPAGTVDIKP
jgi:hypothetical protein